MTNPSTPQRQADIFSPITDGVVPNRTPATEARKAGRKALEDLVERTGRRHIIIAAVTIGTCCAFPTLSMLNDGYKVFPVVDACGGWSRYEAEAAISRMSNAGAELVTTFALACELQADWKLPTANAMLDPFNQNLPEYAFVIGNFWNNANQHAVPDPFGMVK